MADTEGFLGRWSRLKRETAQQEAEPPAAEEPAPPPEPASAEAEPEREPLPPIESLGADSDYTRFLATDVPAEVARLALRKAWVSDPKIADFRGFAEYDWDCNAPGYGALRATDNVAELLDAVFGDRPPEPPPEPVPAPVAEAEAPPEEAVEVAENDSLEEKREQGGETSDAPRC